MTDFILERAYGAMREIERLIGYIEGEREHFANERSNFRLLTFSSIAKTTQKEAMQKISGKIEKQRAYFTKKEINNMPTLKDCHIRIKANGSYEIRYRRCGIEKSFSAKNLKDAKSKCFHWLKMLNHDIKRIKQPEDPKDTAFIEFADNYMDTVKKPNVGKETYEKYYQKYKLYIQQPYRNVTFQEMPPIRMQKDLSSLRERSGRNYEDVRILLNGIFKYAIANGILERNPLDAVFVMPHERTTGKALTYDAERSFVEAIRGSVYESAYLIMLYTGCRPCEYASFTFNREEDTITLANGKLKRHQKIKSRTIPVFPMLRPHLAKILAEDFTFKTTTLNENLKRILPDYTLKDLRHTFASRAIECGCNPEVVNYWQAHVIGDNMTAKVYTHFSIEFQKKEAEKLNYYNLL